MKTLLSALSIDPYRKKQRNLLLGAGMMMLAFISGHALAHLEPQMHVEEEEHTSAPPSSDALDTSGNLLGDMGGFRTWLHQYGVTLNLQTDDEYWKNTAGGRKHKGVYNGVGTVQVSVDMEKLMGLEGGLFNLSWLNIRGRSITEDQLGDYNPISGYEAYQSNRLFELWYQHSFSDSFDVRVGQQALDNEFLISDYASLFINSNFGWPMAPSINLYAGGPSWPLAAPAVRFRYLPDDQWTLMFAAATDNPTGHSFYNEDDPSNQSVYPHGDNFNLHSGTLFIGEAQYSFNPQPEDLSTLSYDPGLPGTYKIGAMYDTAHFPDQRYDKEGNQLASEDSTGRAREHRGNWIFYAVVDQMVWRPQVNSAKSLGVFARVTGNKSDRNVVNFVMDAGINLKAPFEGREEDTFGIGWGMAHTSSRARQADRDLRALSDSYYPIRSNEHHIEVTYQAQITPWLVIQPDFQYIRRPGGGTLNEETGKKVGSETIFGLHTRVIF